MANGLLHIRQVFQISHQILIFRFDVVDVFVFQSQKLLLIQNLGAKALNFESQFLFNFCQALSLLILILDLPGETHLFLIQLLSQPIPLLNLCRHIILLDHQNLNLPLKRFFFLLSISLNLIGHRLKILS